MVILLLFPVTVDELTTFPVGAVSSSKKMGFDENKETGEKSDHANEEHYKSEGEPLSRHVNESSIHATEDEEDEVGSKLQLGPQCTLKEHLEKDKVCLSAGIYRHVMFHASFLID